VEGETREYIVSVPDGPFDTARPLIFGFHGMMYDAEWVANGEEPTSGPYFGMEAEAAGAAIFVAPQALSGGWSNQGGRDISFVEAMISELSAQLCVDEARIFATGFSFGGIMTANIGCELFDSFRAVAPQSASLPSVCTDGLPALPYLGIHGTEDTTIQLSQGELVRDSYVARNGCDMSASGPDENGCMVYENCEPEAPVTFCTFTGVHEPAPFTGPVIWNFFAQF
jgi:poly(3-hydroxybutyrate) depolymerase